MSNRDRRMGLLFAAALLAVAGACANLQVEKANPPKRQYVLDVSRGGRAEGQKPSRRISHSPVSWTNLRSRW